jgi:hypothetical protein
LPGRVPRREGGVRNAESRWVEEGSEGAVVALEAGSAGALQKVVGVIAVRRCLNPEAPE